MKLVCLLLSLCLLIPTLQASVEEDSQDLEGLDDSILLHRDLENGGIATFALNRVKLHLRNLDNHSNSVSKAVSEFEELLTSAHKMGLTKKGDNGEEVTATGAVSDPEKGTYAEFVREDEDSEESDRKLFAKYLKDENRNAITIEVDFGSHPRKFFGIQSTKHKASLTSSELGSLELRVEFEGKKSAVSRVWKLNKSKLDWNDGYVDYLDDEF